MILVFFPWDIHKWRQNQGLKLAWRHLQTGLWYNDQNDKWGNYQLIVTSENPGHGSEPVTAVEGTFSAGDEHVGDDAYAPAVGGRRGVRALDHFRR